MVVYIDILVFTNIIINYCILSATKKILHIKTKEYRLIIASIIGAVFSLFAVLPDMNSLVSVIIKILCSITMCFSAFSFTSTTMFFKRLLCLFFITVTFTAVMITFYEVFKPNKMYILNDTVYFDIDSVQLILISIAIYICVLLTQKILKLNLSNTLVNLSFSLDNKQYNCIGKVDTGCTLTEPFSGSPIIITERKLIKDFQPKTYRIVPYKALGNNGILIAVKADSVYIDKKRIFKDIYICIHEESIDPNFQAIINYDILR